MVREEILKCRMTIEHTVLQKNQNRVLKPVKPGSLKRYWELLG